MAAADRDTLLAWSRAFVETHGRRPTREDMPEDVGERRSREGESERERERQREEREEGKTLSALLAISIDKGEK